MTHDLPKHDIWSLDTKHLGQKVIYLETVDSTNNLALHLAKEVQNQGVIVLADRQTAGRGQYGRSWESPPNSGVWMSVLLFPPAEFRRPVLMTAFATVAIGETIQQVTSLQAKIKWPNDLLIKGKKTCGVLIEAGTQPGSLPYIIIGIGLNVNQSRDDLDRISLAQATSLAIEVGRSLDRHGIAQVLIRHLDAEYGRLLHGEINTLEACWKWRIGLLGKPVVVYRNDGSEVRGRLTEMSFQGLEIQSSGGEVQSLPPENIKHVYALMG